MGFLSLKFSLYIILNFKKQEYMTENRIYNNKHSTEVDKKRKNVKFN